MDKKILYLTALENLLLEAIVACCNENSVPRIRNIFRTLEKHFGSEKKINSSMVHQLVKNILLPLKILEVVLRKVKPGERKASITYELKNEVLKKWEVKIVARRTEEMLAEMGLPLENGKKKEPKEGKKEKNISFKKEGLSPSDLELVESVEEKIQNKKEEITRLEGRITKLKTEVTEMEMNLQEYGKSRLSLVKFSRK